MRLARTGKITYYRELGAAVGKHERWALWTRVLDEIGLEEGPDITFLVLSARKGWPSRIGKKFMNEKPTSEQRQAAQSGLNEVFRHYCPSKTAPRLPQRKR
jgi:hypothetical protein